MYKYLMNFKHKQKKNTCMNEYKTAFKKNKHQILKSK